MACALVWFALSVGSTRAAGIVGDGTPGSCTENALAAALAGGGGIAFDCGADPLTITMTAGPLTVTREAMLYGGGRITLDGGGASRLLYVSPGASLSLAGLTLANASSAGGCGAAVHSEGSLSLVDVTVRDSHALTGTDCGVIAAFGELLIANSVIVHNTAVVSGTLYLDGAARALIADSRLEGNAAAYGGAVYVGAGAAVTITNSRLLGNTAGDINDPVFSVGGAGGAIFNAGIAHLSGVTVTGNTARYNGGGIDNPGRLTLKRSTIEGNNSLNNGGGLHSTGSAALDASLVALNSAYAYGSGICAYGPLTVTRTLIANNFSAIAAGIYAGSGAQVYVSGSVLMDNRHLAQGTLTIYSGVTAILENVTIGRIANYYPTAGAIDAGGVLTMTNSIVISNDVGLRQGGWYRSSRIFVRNSIIAHNRTQDCDDVVADQGYNLAGDATCAFSGPGSLNGVDVRLSPEPLPIGPLVGAGAGTRLLLWQPLPGSPALDIVPGLPGIDYPALDARGTARPIGARADSGAVEGGPFAWYYLPTMAR
ncbi:MAG: hypothetical protein HZB53_11730 [Chloroflexi bacterium]|nr:hypothetical protein [Chloroflexota bacterium]